MAGSSSLPSKTARNGVIVAGKDAVGQGSLHSSGAVLAGRGKDACEGRARKLCNLLRWRHCSFEVPARERHRLLPRRYLARTLGVTNGVEKLAKPFARRYPEFRHQIFPANQLRRRYDRRVFESLPDDIAHQRRRAGATVEADTRARPCRGGPRAR